MTTPVLNKEGLEKAREAFYAATTVLPTGTIRDLDAGVSAYLSASISDVAGVVERLTQDANQLDRMSRLASFAGAETGVRVKDTSALLDDLREAAALITALSAENARLREKAIVGEYMWTPGEVMEVVARAEAAEARVKEMGAALETERERIYQRILDLTETEVIGGMVLDSEGRTIVRKLREADVVTDAVNTALAARSVAEEAGR